MGEGSYTPDRDPGTRHEEMIEFSVESAPTQEGQMAYDGVHLYFNDGTENVDLLTGGSGGISEAQHRDLDQLVHDITETSYDEVTYSGGQVTNLTTWDSASKTTKIRETQVTYDAGKVSQTVEIQYESDGVTVAAQFTEVYTYTAGKVSSVARTRNV